MGDKAGGKQVAGANTFHLIQYFNIPHHKRKVIIYTKAVCEIQEGNGNKNCTRITVGGNLIFYPVDAGTNKASLELIKLMLNSVISRKGAQFSTMDIKNFYLDIDAAATSSKQFFYRINLYIYIKFRIRILCVLLYWRPYMCNLH